MLLFFVKKLCPTVIISKIISSTFCVTTKRKEKVFQLLIWLPQLNLHRRYVVKVLMDLFSIIIVIISL